MLNQLFVIVKLITKAYENKNYNQVYSYFLDFMKYNVLDFYLRNVKDEIILN